MGKMGQWGVYVAAVWLSHCQPTPTPSQLKQEADDRRTPRTDALLDQSSRIAERINSELDRIRQDLEYRGNLAWTPEQTQEFLNLVKDALGANRRGTGLGLDHVGIPLEVSQYTETEAWILNTFSEANGELLKLKFKDSRYGDNPIGPIVRVVPAHIAEATADHSIAPTVKINDVLIGIDKIGHLFQQGYWYFDAAARGVLKNPDDFFEFGQFMEGDPDLPSELHKKYRKLFGEYCAICTLFGGFGYFGATSTGVISYGDMAANLAGLDFYTRLQEDPGHYVFDFSDYDVASWNEDSNPNRYIKELIVRP